MSAKFQKLLTLLKELFQLDQPDLDFGIYRILHARSEEITRFLEKDLLPQVREAFWLYKTADKAELVRELAELKAGIERAGMDPTGSPKVQELERRLREEAVDVAGLEAEVYDHLYSFFRRYYSEGDFLSKRVYKPGVYAIPYEGEEVKLHWANADQYYIKTSEYLRDFAFRLRPDDAKDPMRVHFRLVDAVEGEHGNVKAAEGRGRVFVLASDGFIAEEPGESSPELVLRFEYRPATLDDWPADQRAGQARPPAQRDLSAAAEARILDVRDTDLARWIDALGAAHVKSDGTRADYSRLAAHLSRYTARNTFDYFIHKDLGGFLRRELDFYIKNEVMHLDDIEHETAPRVEQYLSKIRVIRRIAGKLIDLLAQLEDFQKKLWLKKKFVVETSWCIRVGCIPEEFYPEIAANEAQREEWVKLCAINEIKGDLATQGYSDSLNPEFVAAHSTLVVDTRHFDKDFTARLLACVGSLEELTDSLVFSGDNYHALGLAQKRLKGRIACAYIDPPYNTEQDRATGKFLYKDSYQRSSWVSLMDSRLQLLATCMGRDAVLFASIDEHEVHRLIEIALARFRDRVGVFTWVKKKKGSHLSRKVRDLTEYVVAVAVDGSDIELFGERAYANKPQPLAKRTNKPKELRFPLGSVKTRLHDGSYPPGKYGEGTSAITFLDELRVEGGRVLSVVRAVGPFVWQQSMLNAEIASGSVVHLSTKFGFNVLRSGQDERVKRPPTLLDKGCGVGTNEDATAELIDLFGREGVASYPKPITLVAYLARACSVLEGEFVMDCFAGSGTTGHALISLNREGGDRRKFVLVELGDYFDTVLLPRLKKVTYTPEWKDGKPKRLATAEEAERSPRIMKVMRLESYEDALNNLDLRRTPGQQSLLDLAESQGTDGLTEQYRLRYLLDVETRGSQSLLNVGAFADPTAYTLKVKKPGSDESREVNVDLIETFNWLIGLSVQHLAAPRTFAAGFERDAEQRLRLAGALKPDPAGPWWFRTVSGTTPDGRKTLVIWRKLTGVPEEDNLVLDAWFTKQGYSSQDREFDLIYVNGGNNLENLKTPEDLWKVRLIEEDFQRLMFDTEDA